jgi:hypothetical protein
MQKINGILLLYDHPLEPNAPTIMEHVDAFARHSRFKTWCVNTGLGFPKSLSELDFTTIVLHYSLFGSLPFKLDDYFERYLDRSRAYKVAFFQDEHQLGPQRFEFLNRYQVDCVYTLLEPRHWDEVYRRYTAVPKLVYTLPGYVSEDLVALAGGLTQPDDVREIDIGYRTRTLPLYMGKGGQEKVEIAARFLERAQGTDLKLDIGVDEASRIYGPAWFEFLASCRGVLGVEAGVSIFDTEDVVRQESERLLASDPELSVAGMFEKVLEPWEDNIFYRTISPRHFDAAALRVCQILFEGKYSGILQPMVHYIPLKKDFSNLDDVIRSFRDPALRRTLTENAYRDLIASGGYSYERFVASFDDELLAAGLQPQADETLAAAVTARLARDRRQREAAIHRRAATLGRQFPGREQLARAVRPLLKRVRRWKYRRWERTLTPEADG